jgi:hypothetical protein
MSEVLGRPAHADGLQHSSSVVAKVREAERLALSRRRLTVNLRIEAEAGDDSPLGSVVAEALKEYLKSPAGQGAGGDAMQGFFEAQSGPDVHWHCLNHYYLGDQLVGMVGVDAQGRRFDVLEDTPEGAKVRLPESPAYAVPADVAVMEGEGTIVIKGVRCSMEVFKTLADPNPAKRYVFTRSADGVFNVVERT